MDAALLIQNSFWDDETPIALGGFVGVIPEVAELRGHVLFQTSGSMGVAKWVALSKTALRISAGAINQHLDVTADSCWGLALPIHHLGGFGVAARAFDAGCRMECFSKKWNALVFAEWVAACGVTHISLVPTQVYDLVASRVTAPASLRAVVVGGGHLAESIGQAARDLGWPVLASYGMTEAASQIATQGLESMANVYQSAPIPVLSHWDVATTTDGRLRIAGAALFSGMLISEHEGWSYRPREGGWYETQDKVELDHRMLWPIGRADLQVKVLGELVNLDAIEREIVALSNGLIPSGSLVIVAVPDERSEHVLVPVFDGLVDREQVEAALVAYERAAPGFRRLQAPVFLDDFPRSALGKPRRGECARRVIAKCTGAGAP